MGDFVAQTTYLTLPGRERERGDRERGGESGRE